MTTDFDRENQSIVDQLQYVDTNIHPAKKAYEVFFDGITEDEFHALCWERTNNYMFEDEGWDPRSTNRTMIAYGYQAVRRIRAYMRRWYPHLADVKANFGWDLNPSAVITTTWRAADEETADEHPEGSEFEWILDQVSSESIGEDLDADYEEAMRIFGDPNHPWWPELRADLG